MKNLTTNLYNDKKEDVIIPIPPPPWIHSGAFKAIDDDYYIGSLVRESNGCVICSISHGGSKYSEEIVNLMLKAICDKFNE